MNNIVEIKNEYTECLVKNITPLLHEGIQSMYADAKEFKLQQLGKDNGATISDLFQHLLKEAPKMTSELLEKETHRIKLNARCGEWFDDLIKAVVKSNILLLTNTVSGQVGFNEDEYHSKISTQDFIHKCYIEAARELYNYPELYTETGDSIQLNKNKREAMNIIETSVREAIRKLLPMKMILKDYLEASVNKFNTEKISHAKPNDIRDHFKKLSEHSHHSDHDSHHSHHSEKMSANSYSEHDNVMKESDFLINKDIEKELDKEIDIELGF